MGRPPQTLMRRLAEERRQNVELAREIAVAREDRER